MNWRVCSVATAGAQGWGGCWLRAWMGLVPAATIFMPSAMMAALRMVAVVVPSPAVSFVFDAACAGHATQGHSLWGQSCQCRDGPCRARCACCVSLRQEALVLPYLGERTRPNNPHATPLLIIMCHCLPKSWPCSSHHAVPDHYTAAHACLAQVPKLAAASTKQSGGARCPTGVDSPKGGHSRLQISCALPSGCSHCQLTHV